MTMHACSGVAWNKCLRFICTPLNNIAIASDLIEISLLFAWKHKFMTQSVVWNWMVHGWLICKWTLNVNRNKTNETELLKCCSFYSSQSICNRLYLRSHFIKTNMSRQHNKVVSCDTIDLSRYGDMLPQHQLWIMNNAMHAAYLPLKQPAHIYHNNPHIHRFARDLPSAIVRINAPISFSQRPAVDRFAHKT